MFRYARGALRSLLPIALFLILLGAVAVPITGSIVERNGMFDLDARASSVSASLQGALEQWSQSRGEQGRAVARGALERIARGERVVGLGLCDADGAVVHMTQWMPRSVQCPRLEAGSAQARPDDVQVPGRRIDGERTPLHLATLNVPAAQPEGRAGTLLVASDMRFVEQRKVQARWFVLGLVLLFGLTISVVTLIVARQSWNDFVEAARALVRETTERSGSAAAAPSAAAATDSPPWTGGPPVSASSATAQAPQGAGRAQAVGAAGGAAGGGAYGDAGAGHAGASEPGFSSERDRPAGGDRRGSDMLDIFSRARSSREFLPELRPLARDLQRILREVESEQRVSSTVGDAKVWSPETLRDLLKRNFPGDEVIVLSNREPYIHQREKDGSVRVNRPASGLVTAVEPVMRACSGTWIAHGAGSADRDSVDAQDRVQVPPDSPSYTLRRIWLNDEEEQGFYYGFSNEGMWPLCHVAHVRPVFRTSDWEYYCQINERFAQAVVQEARTKDPIVLIQDYHFAMAPAMVRRLLPDATIITFWHIPWPNFESFGICPWKEDILEGLLGSDILGFHTPYHCANFIQTVDRFLEARIERESDTISVGGNLTSVNAYPISIAWPDPVEPAQFPEIRRSIRDMYQLPEAHRIAIGVDRLDYTKGMVERFRSVERLLELHPEWVGKFTLIQIAAPSRSSLSEYQRFDADVRQQAEQLNARYRDAPDVPPGYEPIKLLVEHHDHASVQKHYRAADICVVTSLHDGMNLVSKEFVASHDDERGVLVLSRFAGAAGELLDALIVNPYHVDEVAEALHEALLMDEQEQAVRMRSLRHNVRDFNVFRWAGRLLIDAGKLRRRVRVENRLRSAQGSLGSHT